MWFALGSAAGAMGAWKMFRAGLTGRHAVVIVVISSFFLGGLSGWQPSAASAPVLVATGFLGALAPLALCAASAGATQRATARGFAAAVALCLTGGCAAAIVGFLATSAVRSDPLSSGHGPHDCASTAVGGSSDAARRAQPLESSARHSPTVSEFTMKRCAG